MAFHSSPRVVAPGHRGFTEIPPEKGSMVKGQSPGAGNPAMDTRLYVMEAAEALTERERAATPTKLPPPASVPSVRFHAHWPWAALPTPTHTGGLATGVRLMTRLHTPVLPFTSLTCTASV